MLKELESPEGFILSDDSAPRYRGGRWAGSGNLPCQRAHLRRPAFDEGGQKDYPDNKLTGAEFEVYRDTNGNKELDEGDELLGKLEETSTGIYEMSTSSTAACS